MSDEAHFYLSEFVNKHNFWYCQSQTAKKFHERPLYSYKVTACSTISLFVIIGLYYFEDKWDDWTTLHSHVGELAHWLVNEMFFWQCGATRHAAQASTAFVSNLFLNHVVSIYGEDIIWLSQSHDISAHVFCLGVPGMKLSKLQHPTELGFEILNSII